VDCIYTELKNPVKDFSGIFWHSRGLGILKKIRNWRVPQPFDKIVCFQGRIIGSGARTV
jgi:hypothetical protein